MTRVNSGRTILIWVTTALLACLFGGTGSARATGDLSGRWGLGVEGGIATLSGGDRSYSNVDQYGSILLNRGLSREWNLQFAFTYGYVRPAVGSAATGAAIFTFDSGAPLYTPLLQPMVRLQRRFELSPVLVPFVGVGAGVTSWKVVDKTGQNVGVFPGGDAARGYDKDGNPTELKGTELTLGLELGLDVVLSGNWALALGGRFNMMPGVKKDNVGLSSLWGPDHVDANTMRTEGFLAVTWWWGDDDRDDDGIPNERDACPDVAEDIDGYQDTDGCPDPDNDSDGVPDHNDACPDQPEDMDGYQDQDGCPDPDNDGDGIVDARDGCPDEAEDMDGFQDDDGCPDPDNDGDGVADARDSCPDTPPNTAVDADGCAIAAAPLAATAAVLPAPGQRIALKGVTFHSSSARLNDESFPVLTELAAAMVANPVAIVEVRGHTDSVGPAAANLDLSRRRAVAVRDALIRRGVNPGHITAVGYGEDYPVADNHSAAGRARNRRVELHRVE